MNEVKAGTNGVLQPKRENGFKKFVLKLCLVCLLIGAIIFYWHYCYVYNQGYNNGVLIKFSFKGNIFRTYEGEIVQPSLHTQSSDTIKPANFFFSVTNKNLGDSLEKIIGKNIMVHYVQYHGPLPWRGNNYNGQNQEDGQFIVDSIMSIEK